MARRSHPFSRGTAARSGDRTGGRTGGFQPEQAFGREIDALSRSVSALLARNGRLEQVLERRLTDFERRLEQSLLDLLQQSLASMFGGTAEGSGLLATGLLPRLAAGGVVDGPQVLALGGEAGPEAVLPLSRGSDGRLGVRVEWPAHAAGGGQAKSSTLFTAIDRINDQQTDHGLTMDHQALSAQMAGALNEALDQAIAHRLHDHLRDGGLLAPFGQRP